MDKRTIVIVVGILVIVVLGLVFVSNMTGNVITGSAAMDEVVENDLFRIDEINEVEEELNDTQNSSGSG